MKENTTLLDDFDLSDEQKFNFIARFQLNFYQAIGLITVALGRILVEFLDNPIENGIYFLGIIVFLISSKPTKAVIISFSILCIGFIIKMQHWPFSMFFILTGFISLAFSIYYWLIMYRLKTIWLYIYLSFLVLMLGDFLTIFHLGFGSEILFLGFISLTVCYILRFVKKDQKNIEDFIKLLIVIFWSFSTVFIIFHLPSEVFLTTIFNLLLLSLGIIALVKNKAL